MRIAILVSAFGVLVACGPQGGEVPLGPEHAGTAGNALAATAEESVAFYDFNLYENPGAPPAVASTAPRNLNDATAFTRMLQVTPVAQEADECHTVSGDLTDPDGDEIPTDARVDVDCSGTDNNAQLSLTGTLKLQDTLPQTASAFNFHAGQENLVLTATAPNYSASITENWSVDSAQSGASWELNQSASVSAEENAGNQSHSFSVSHDLLTGLNVTTAEITIDGSWSVRASDGNQTGAADSTLSTAPSVTVDPACADHIVGGAVEATYSDSSGADAILRAEWSGCGNITIFYNGSVVPQDNS